MNAKVFKLITAICFAVVGTIEFIWGLVLAVRSVTWYYVAANALIYFIIGGLIWAAAAVLIFINKNKLFTIIGIGSVLFWSFIGLFLNRAVLRNIFLFLALAMLGFYALLYFKPDLIKLPGSLIGMLKKILWFVPAVTFFLFGFISWFVYRMSFLMILRDFAIIGGLLLGGLWLASLLPDTTANAAESKSSAIGVPAAERVVSQCAVSTPVAGEGLWTCPNCGRTGNTANFCMKCGTAKPVITEPVAEPEPEVKPVFNEDGTWNCPTCGKDHNPGNFCMKCGTAKPEAPAVEQAVEDTVEEIIEEPVEEITETVAEEIIPEEAVPETPVVEEVAEETVEEVAETAAEEVVTEEVTPVIPVVAETVAENVVSKTLSADTWVCPTCGKEGNSGKFCGVCGTAKPESSAKASSDDGSWICPACGKEGNKGRFCGICGTPRP